MKITRQSLQALAAGIETKFMGIFNSIDTPVLDALATVSVTGQDAQRKSEVKIPISLDNFRMREWVGRRHYQNIIDTMWKIESKIYEATFDIMEEDIERDSLDFLDAKIAELARLAKLHPEHLLVDLLEAGRTSTCYDGQYFFDTDHPLKSGFQSNLITTGFSKSTVQEAIERLMAMKTYGGEPMGLTPTHIVVPTSKYFETLEMFKNNASQGNVLHGMLQIVSTARLTDQNTVYVMSLDREAKPFFGYREYGVRYRAMTNPLGEAVFEERKYRYGVDYGGGVNYGFPQMAVCITNP